MRLSNRLPDNLREVSLTRNVAKYAEGSCLVKFGDTHVICTASVEKSVPHWLRNTGKGWVTAEYSMLPRATGTRVKREAVNGQQTGRTLEIQRLIGRALRAVTDLKALGEMQIIIDCDVLQADGGTRTAAITGAWVALYECLTLLEKRQLIKRDKVLLDHVAAVSCGIYSKELIVDLDYQEDSNAQADVNFVMTSKGEVVEVQGTAEKTPFSQEEFMKLFQLADKAIKQLVEKQKQAVSQSTES